MPALLEQVKEELKEGKCCVIGLQSTGEARTTDAVEMGEELDEFLSAPQEMLKKCIEKCLKLPYNNPNGGDTTDEESDSDEDEDAFIDDFSEDEMDVGGEYRVASAEC